MAALPAPAPLPLPLLSLGGPRVAVAVGIVTAVFLFAAAVWCVQSWSGAVVKRRSAGQSSGRGPGWSRDEAGREQWWLAARGFVSRVCVPELRQSNVSLANPLSCCRCGARRSSVRLAAIGGVERPRGEGKSAAETREQRKSQRKQTKKEEEKGRGRWPMAEGREGRTQSRQRDACDARTGCARWPLMVTAVHCCSEAARSRSIR